MRLSNLLLLTFLTQSCAKNALPSLTSSLKISSEELSPTSSLANFQRQHNCIDKMLQLRGGGEIGGQIAGTAGVVGLIGISSYYGAIIATVSILASAARSCRSHKWGRGWSIFGVLLL